jgi:hypothetical protein
MGTCQVWEYYASGNNRNQVAKLPGKAPQNVTISSTHAETASALDNATIGIRLRSDTACWFKLYKSGAASPLGDVCTTANGIALDANAPEYFDVPMAAGVSISIITA